MKRIMQNRLATRLAVLAALSVAMLYLRAPTKAQAIGCGQCAINLGTCTESCHGGGACIEGCIAVYDACIKTCS
jgi:hypothetical protein